MTCGYCDIGLERVRAIAHASSRSRARVGGLFGSSRLPPGRASGPEIEADPSYQPQTTCDPTPKPGTVALLKLLLQTYPGTRNLGISRECAVIREIPSGVSEHKEGRAIDWGVSALDPTEKAMADDAIEQLLATDKHGNTHALARRLGIMYIVWNKRLWAPKSGWRPYTDSPNPHTDHVHISLTRDGGAGRTSYWTGEVAGPKAAPSTRVQTAPSPWLLVVGGLAFAGSVAALAASGLPRHGARRWFGGRRILGA